MNDTRTVISAFLLTHLTLVVAGWIWAGDLPSEKLTGARLVLTLCGLTAIGTLWMIWEVKHPEAT